MLTSSSEEKSAKLSDSWADRLSLEVVADIAKESLAGRKRREGDSTETQALRQSASKAQEPKGRRQGTY
ncbi:hypothetical protein AUP68_15169 [Ilyonectria robusta]